MRLASVGLAVTFALALAGVASAATPSPYFNGFETDAIGWTNANRVISTTNGVTSASGAWHAEAGSAFTTWNGYTTQFPANGYSTAVDIYLNPAGKTDDTRFDWTSAVSTPTGGHRRDFVFNAGVYNDGTPHFVVSASNNSGRGSSFPKNPERNPIAITDAGWYTFQHDFTNVGGVLSVRMSIRPRLGTTELGSWTLSDATDVIGSTVGGNRYGWFALNEFGGLAIDNSQLLAEVGPPVAKIECKDGGWRQYNNPVFKNQGECVSYLATAGIH